MVWRYLTCCWNLLLFYHSTCRFRRKKQVFLFQWEKFLSMIWNLYIVKKRVELNFKIYFVRLLRWPWGITIILKWLRFRSSIFTLLQRFLLSLKYFCFPIIFIQIFLFFAFLQILFFCFPSNIYIYFFALLQIFLISFEYFLLSFK